MTYRRRAAAMAKGLGLIALTLLAGCAAFAPKLEAPRVTLVNVGMLSADIFSQQFRIRLHVQNPNDRDLPIKGIEYELFLEGDSFAEGVSNAPFVVPALGEVEFDTTVRTNFVSSIGRLLSRMSKSEGNKVHYDFVGKVAVDKMFVGDIPFKESGEVDLATLNR